MRRHKKKLKKMSNAFCFKVGFLLYLYDSTKTTTYSVTMVQCKGRQTTWAEVAPEKICGWAQILSVWSGKEERCGGNNKQNGKGRKVPIHKRGNKTDKQNYEEIVNLTGNQINKNQNNTLLLTCQTSKHFPSHSIRSARHSDAVVSQASPSTAGHV